MPVTGTVSTTMTWRPPECTSDDAARRPPPPGRAVHRAGRGASCSRRSVRRARRRRPAPQRDGRHAAPRPAGTGRERRARGRHGVRPLAAARAVGWCSTSSRRTACRASTSTPSWSRFAEQQGGLGPTAPSCTPSPSAASRTTSSRSSSPTTAATGRSSSTPTADLGRLRCVEGARDVDHRPRRRRPRPCDLGEVTADFLSSRIQLLRERTVSVADRQRSSAGRAGCCWRSSSSGCSPSASTRDAGPQTEGDRVDGIARRIACPICDGESVYESRNNASVNIRTEIEAQVRARASAPTTRSSATSPSAYRGDVLLVPKAPASTRSVWALPRRRVVCGVAGLAVAFRRWRLRPRGRDTAATDDGLRGSSSGRCVMLDEP